ncbi:MAG: hypothetical protein ABI231_09755, partial [Candidatus Tumulicola sp.]
LWDVTVTGVSLAGGYALSVATRRTGEALAGASVRGGLTNGRMQIATLIANAVGNGELTITSTGAQYPLIDWTVVR